MKTMRRIITVIALCLIAPNLFAQGWNAVSSAITSDLYSVSFVNQNQGWAVGSNGTILTTSQGGTSWTAQNSGVTGFLMSVDFVDALNGWAVGNNGVILNTIDGGTTWNAQVSGTTEFLYAVDFVDDLFGYAVGANGTILSTITGGTAWTVQTSGTVEILFNTKFIDANNGWVAGYTGTILRTMDGGSTWTAQNSGVTSDFYNIEFTDLNNGWAGGSTGTLLNTSDGGATWSAQQINTLGIGGIDFIHPDTGWVAGSSGTIWATQDGGTTWNLQTSNSPGDLFLIQFVDANRGWAVGALGAMVKTTNGGWVCPDIASGEINGSISLAASTANDGKVYLFHYDDSIAWDTTAIVSIDINGNYQFSGIDTGNYVIKVVLDEISFVTAIPTYYPQTYDMNAATYISVQCDTQTINMNAIEIIASIAGNGSISGNVFYGSEGKMQATGDPIPGLEVMLDKSPPSGIVATTTTNTNGQYQFNGLEQGHYIVYTGIPGLNSDTLHEVDITAVNESFQSLNYGVDTVNGLMYLTNVGGVIIAENDYKNSMFTVFPSPASEKLNISSHNFSSSYSIVVKNALGQEIYRREHIIGKCEIDLKCFREGLYVITLLDDDKYEYRKFIKKNDL